MLGAGGGCYGAFPIEAAIFADAGVTSAGAALRANLLGFAIGELDLVKPFQRSQKGWYLDFSLIPGF